jgi:hypothetical protein
VPSLTLVSGFKDVEDTPHIATMNSHQVHVQQLEGKAIVPTVEMGETSPRRLHHFELAADGRHSRIAPA